MRRSVKATKGEVQGAVNDTGECLLGRVEVLVPYEHWGPARPNCCFPNVEARVSRDGGGLVCGWVVMTECRGLVQVYYHHAAWQKPSGELVDLTPKVWWDGTLFLEPTRFVADPGATPLGVAPHRTTRPPRYYPLVDDPGVKRFANTFQASEVAYYAGDMHRCSYYTRRAEQAANRYFSRVGQPPIQFRLPSLSLSTF